MGRFSNFDFRVSFCFLLSAFCFLLSALPPIFHFHFSIFRPYIGYNGLLSIGTRSRCQPACGKQAIVEEVSLEFPR